MVDDLWQLQSVTMTYTEPIVCTPEDAYRCFMGTELDLLVCGNSILRKEDNTARIADYSSQYALD